MTAKEILESQVWKDAIEALRQRLVEEFERTSGDSPDELQSVAYRLAALRSITDDLKRELKQPSINLKTRR